MDTEIKAIGNQFPQKIPVMKIGGEEYERTCILPNTRAHTRTHTQGNSIGVQAQVKATNTADQAQLGLTYLLRDKPSEENSPIIIQTKEIKIRQTCLASRIKEYSTRTTIVFPFTISNSCTTYYLKAHNPKKDVQREAYRES